MATINGVAEDHLQIAAEVFEIIEQGRELPSENVQWFVDAAYQDATDKGRGLYDMQMASRDRKDLTAPFKAATKGEVIPIFTLLFSRRDDLEPEPFYDVAQWGVTLSDAATWVNANKLAEEFGKGNRPREWFDPDYQKVGPEPPPEDDEDENGEAADKPRPAKPPAMVPDPVDRELVVDDSGVVQVSDQALFEEKAYLIGAGLTAATGILGFIAYKLITGK